MISKIVGAVTLTFYDHQNHITAEFSAVSNIISALGRLKNGKLVIIPND